LCNVLGLRSGVLLPKFYVSCHGPIFPNLAKSIVPTNLNQLWVADITYIAIATGFVYLAAILDAWSRRVVGYAIGKRRGRPLAAR
jgi:transposase InsO family protein